MKINEYIHVLPFSQPMSVIFWKLNGNILSKTVCYTAEDEQNALDRFRTKGDFYNQYDDFFIQYCRMDERVWA